MTQHCLPQILLSLASIVLLGGESPAADWIHWRGPEQNGLSREKNLPGDFDPAMKQKGNVIWQKPFGGRSAPLVMAGRLYIIQGVGDGVNEGEQIVCFDEATGNKLWEHRVGVFHTDIVSSRLGWTTLTADPATGYVYAHTTGGHLLCLDAGGKVVWSRQLTEEFGRVTGYGGRNASPIFDSGLVIVGMANASWGDHARGANRFVAFDGKSGKIVWWSTPNPDTLHGTYYSSPVIAVINGQRLLISGGADGGLHALKVRTGEPVWSLSIAKGVVNGSPIVNGNFVYVTHGEENPEGAPIGRIICLDGSQVDPMTRKPKVVWDTFRRVYKANRNQPLASRFGLASAALADGLLYAPDDSGELFCFRAKDGEMLWKYRYATEVRGSPLIADGKLYIFDVKARILILTLEGEKRPDEDNTFSYRFPGPGGLLNETNGTPIAVNGRVYFTTRTDLFCVGDPKAKPAEVKYTPLPEEAKFDPNAVAGIRLFPVDVTAKPGETVTFQVVVMDANGRETKGVLPEQAKWSLPAPPAAKAGGNPPPALQGMIQGNNAEAKLTLAELPSQQGYVEVEFGKIKARARVRVATQLPYSQDFDKMPDGAAPGGWVNAAGKFFVTKRPDGTIVLAKVNTDSRPPIARANAYITSPESANYTIEADLMGTAVRNKQADMGLVNSRYTIILGGATDPETGKRQVRIQSWDGKRRVDVGGDFDWAPDTWYTVKLSVDQKEKTALVQAKVWKKGDKEPEKWTVEFDDPNPNRSGAAALYGYVSNVIPPQADDPGQAGSQIFYDNVKITQNAKK